MFVVSEFMGEQFVLSSDYTMPDEVNISTEASIPLSNNTIDINTITSSPVIINTNVSN